VHGARNKGRGQRQQIAEKQNSFVTPAEAGVQKNQERLDSRLRGNDIKGLKKD